MMEPAKTVDGLEGRVEYSQLRIVKTIKENKVWIVSYNDNNYVLKLKLQDDNEVSEFYKSFVRSGGNDLSMLPKLVAIVQNHNAKASMVYTLWSFAQGKTLNLLKTDVTRGQMSQLSSRLLDPWCDSLLNELSHLEEAGCVVPLDTNLDNFLYYNDSLTYVDVEPKPVKEVDKDILRSTLVNSGLFI